jgi:hypothetical protein
MEFVRITPVANVVIGAQPENRMPALYQTMGNRSLMFPKTMSRAMVTAVTTAMILIKMGTPGTAGRSKNASPSISEFATKHLLMPQ